MFRLEKVETASFRADYAKRADFCELFEREMKPLYLLAFLLTANHQDAEKCFAAAVDEALEEPVVFKEWAESWVKRSLVRNAIGIVSPASTRSGGNRDLWNRGQEEAPGDNEIDAVTQLAPLRAFRFCHVDSGALFHLGLLSFAGLQHEEGHAGANASIAPAFKPGRQVSGS